MHNMVIVLVAVGAFWILGVALVLFMARRRDKSSAEQPKPPRREKPGYRK